MKNCYFVLTDSGRIQEEAPTFGKPVLVLRSKTERQEAIEAKTAKLIGIETLDIISESTKLLTEDGYYNSMSNKINPFGDGHSSERIFSVCLESLK